MDTKSMVFGAFLTFVGIIFGWFASAYYSRKYYLKSGDDLTSATQRLLRAQNVVATLQKYRVAATPIYDTDGYLSGVTVSATGHVGGSSSMIGVGSFTMSEPNRYDRQHEQPESDKPDGHDA